MNNKLKKQLAQMVDTDYNRLMQKKALWQQAYHARQGFLKQLKKEGVRGKEYSNKVVDYDKEHMIVFAV